MTETDLKPLIIAPGTERELILPEPIIGGGMSIRIAGVEYVVGCNKARFAGTFGGVGRNLLDENRRMVENPADADCAGLVEDIKNARDLSPDGVIGVNVLMAILWSEQLIRAAVGPAGTKSKINYVVVGAGFHEDVPLWVADHPEVDLFLMASSGLAAIQMAKQWLIKYGRLPDAIIMEEPPTAGGHLGANKRNVYNPRLRHEVTIPDLLRRYKEQEIPWDIPIIAAGGIWNRKDVDEAIILGAKGVQVATELVATNECDAPLEFKQAYINAKKKDIVLIDSPAGYPGRAIRNKFIDDLFAGKIHDKCRGKGGCLKECECRDHGTHFCLLDRLYMAQEGDEDNGLVFCGSNAWRLRKILPMKQRVRNLIAA